MTKNFVIICFILISLSAFSQRIILNGERNTDNSYQITYTKEMPGTYCIYLNFNSYENTIKPEHKFVVNDYSGILTVLRPIYKDKYIGLSYTYSYRRGIPNPDFDSTFVYLLPFRNGKKLEVRFMNYLGSKLFDEEEPKNWKSFQFISDQPDTVCAVRKGLVVKVTKDFAIDTSNVYSFSSKRNSVMVEHKDGTFAIYQGFNGDNIFVKEGDVVLPQQALGTLIQYDKKGNYQLRFAINFLTENPNEEFVNAPKSRYEYLNPYFQTTDGIIKLSNRKKYECRTSADIILKELTKKEIKKLTQKK